MRAACSFLRSVALVACLAGCMSVGPTYKAPDADLPAAYHTAVPRIFETGPNAPEEWWQAFGDPVLDQLVERGLQSNPDVNIAMSRMREARAQARAIMGETGPQLGIGADASRQWRRDQDRGGAPNSGDGPRNQANVGLDAIWEIDLFGRVRHSREAGWAQARRAEALGRETRRTIAAEIARLYVERRAAERRLELAQHSLELQQRTLSLVEQRVNAGLAPGLDLVRARGAVALLQAGIGPLRAERVRLGNALAVLLDENPGQLDEMLAATGKIPDMKTGSALGVPNNLLRRRPDIQAAEFALIAATAEVGVEKAELYPRLTLPGSITMGFVDIGAGMAREVLASLALVIGMPLFDGGERAANITAAEERVIQTALLYRQTLLAALNEVEQALTDYTGASERRLALDEAVRNNEAAFEQSDVLYRRGFATFLEVLDSQRTLNETLQEQALSQRDLATQLINIYAALGVSDRPE